MADPIAETEIQVGLDAAVHAKILDGYDLRRGKAAGRRAATRWWVLRFTDGQTVRYTSGRAEAFGLGVVLGISAGKRR